MGRLSHKLAVRTSEGLGLSATCPVMPTPDLELSIVPEHCSELCSTVKTFECGQKIYQIYEVPYRGGTDSYNHPTPFSK